MTRSFPHRTLLALVLLAIPACSQPEGYHFDVHPADGTVTYQNKPAVNAIVRFHPVDPAILKLPQGQTGPEVMLTTETDDQGKFVMSTYVADDGVPAGEYTVTVLLPKNETSLEDSDGDFKKANVGDPGDPRSGRDGVKTRKSSDPTAIYRQAATTPLKATVKPTGENHFTYDIK